MKTVKRDTVREAAGRDEAAIVEVLDDEQFDQFHLPGAINVPLGDDFDDRIQTAVPDKGQTVIVYCRDAQCRASAEAAERMEALGYEEVYDYEAGKMDWKRAGLPIEN